MNTTPSETPAQDIAERLIRDLVAEHPDVITVLAPYGIDLCCGGGYPLGEALDRHGIARAQVLDNVARIIARQSERP